MTVTLGAAAIVTVLGALAYALSGNSKIAELGRLSFAVGMLALLLTFRR